MVNVLCFEEDADSAGTEAQLCIEDDIYDIYKMTYKM